MTRDRCPSAIELVTPLATSDKAGRKLCHLDRLYLCSYLSWIARKRSVDGFRMKRDRSFVNDSEADTDYPSDRSYRFTVCWECLYVCRRYALYRVTECRSTRESSCNDFVATWLRACKSLWHSRRSLRGTTPAPFHASTLRPASRAGPLRNP